MSHNLDKYCNDVASRIRKYQKGLTFAQLREELRENPRDTHSPLIISIPTAAKHLKEHLVKDGYVTHQIVKKSDYENEYRYLWNPLRPKTFRETPPLVTIKVHAIIDLRQDTATGKQKLHKIIVRKLRNQSNQPIQQVGHIMWIDLPHTWEELNPHLYVKMHRRETELYNATVQPEFALLQPQRFEFPVKLPFQLNPKDELELRVEYDAEEPKRYFEVQEAKDQVTAITLDLLIQEGRKISLNRYWVDVYTFDRHPLIEKPRLMDIQLPSGEVSHVLRWQGKSLIGRRIRLEWTYD